jgi:lipopolysaccharide/colanic/teichoic acid biosynthesis glycosyltransferase
VALAVIGVSTLSFSVIDDDREQLNANRISGRSRMTSNSPAVRTRKDAGTEKTLEHFNPDMPKLIAGSDSVRADQAQVTYISGKTEARVVARYEPNFFYEAAKRVFDFALGLMLLLIATPIILIAAAAIRFESKGSPFFVQTRLGKNGRPFKIFKLRGMFIDARIRFPTYYDYSKKQDLEFCFHHEEDPRVTKAGNFIRKTSIDELPNLWNVVLGDMSLVGPRPEIPEVMALYGHYRPEYLSVRPGVTCLSKCTGRDKLTKRETIEYDIDYIRNRSFLLDLKILWRTFRGVMLRHDVF